MKATARPRSIESALVVTVVTTGTLTAPPSELNMARSPETAGMRSGARSSARFCIAGFAIPKKVPRNVVVSISQPKSENPGGANSSPS